jgi:hypothetical protein
MRRSKARHYCIRGSESIDEASAWATGELEGFMRG